MSESIIRLIFSILSQQNRAIAGREQGSFLARGGDCKAAGVRTKSAIIEFGKFANASPNVRADT